MKPWPKDLVCCKQNHKKGKEERGKIEGKKKREKKTWNYGKHMLK